ncbi:DMT family transporter [Odoribacter sp. OttesenSCG-928-L07]|nr:DMT family transporter [Odoribacter sp. OttesenSCG-928-L07]MDL2238714.1 DMT family transporter [Bacteroidales bacterium OttesenSCG-928-L14]
MKNKARFKGILFGIIAAVAYGTNPLFSLPLYAEGLSPDSVLFYRYGIGVILLGIILLIKGESLKIQKKEILPLLIFGIIFACSSLFLYQSFLYMDAGIACTILFIYPVLVAVIMAVFFKEKASWLTYSCIILAMIGIALLYRGNGDTTLSTTGLILVALSSLCYAIYIVAVDHSRIRTMSSTKMTFWILVFGSIVFIVRTRFLSELQLVPPTFYSWVNAIGIALFPTIISLLFINISIKNIGPTFAAIFGALEPVTALIIGVFVFHEAITVRIVIGALLILIAVTLVVSGNNILAFFGKKSIKEN